MAILYPITEEYKQKIQQPARQFAGRVLIPKLTATFTRNSVAYKSDGTQVAANLPRFEPGKFGKAIMVEEGTTNLLPSAGATGKTLFGSNNNAFSMNSLVSNFGRSDSYSIKSTQVQNGGNTGFFTPMYTVAANTTYTGSCYIYNAASGSRQFRASLSWYDASNTRISLSNGNPVIIPPNQWVRVTITAMLPSNAAKVRLVAFEFGANSVVNDIYYFDDFMIEQKPYPTSFIDGTRSSETLTIPTEGVLNPQEGTIEFWWKPINQPANTMLSQQTSPPIIQVGNYHQNNSWILWCLNGIRLYVRVSGATEWTGVRAPLSNLNWYQLNKWYHIAVRWENADTFWIFFDGVKYGPYVSSNPFTGIAGNIMSLGRLNASSGNSNALFTDLRISQRAKTDEEILETYGRGL